jgi:hypothetical protein
MTELTHFEKAQELYERVKRMEHMTNFGLPDEERPKHDSLLLEASYLLLADMASKGIQAFVPEQEEEPEEEPWVLKYWPQLVNNKNEEYSYLKVTRDTFLSTWRGKRNPKGAPYIHMTPFAGAIVTFVRKDGSTYKSFQARQPREKGLQKKLYIGQEILVYAKKFAGDGSGYYEVVSPPGHYISSNHVEETDQRLKAEEVR